MAQPKKYTYRIQYIDNTYQIVSWTQSELSLVHEMMNNDKTAVLVGDDIFKVSDIRAVVFLPPEPEPTPEDKNKQEQVLTEWGFVDPDTALWLKANGIDLNKGVN